MPQTSVAHIQANVHVTNITDKVCTSLTIASFHLNIYEAVRQIPAQEPNDRSISAQAMQGPATSTTCQMTHLSHP